MNCCCNRAGKYALITSAPIIINVSAMKYSISTPTATLSPFGATFSWEHQLNFTLTTATVWLIIDCQADWLTLQADEVATLHHFLYHTTLAKNSNLPLLPSSDIYSNALVQKHTRGTLPLPHSYAHSTCRCLCSLLPSLHCARLIKKANSRASIDVLRTPKIFCHRLLLTLL